jgi:hypothetical protein
MAGDRLCTRGLGNRRATFVVLGSPRLRPPGRRANGTG